MAEKPFEAEPGRLPCSPSSEAYEEDRTAYHNVGQSGNSNDGATRTQDTPLPPVEHEQLGIKRWDFGRKHKTLDKELENNSDGTMEAWLGQAEKQLQIQDAEGGYFSERTRRARTEKNMVYRRASGVLRTISAYEAQAAEDAPSWSSDQQSYSTSWSRLDADENSASATQSFSLDVVHPTISRDETKVTEAEHLRYALDISKNYRAPRLRRHPVQSSKADTRVPSYLSVEPSAISTNRPPGLDPYRQTYGLQPSPSGRVGGRGGIPAHRAGYWKCANEECGFCNFAQNISCLRCGASRNNAADFANSGVPTSSADESPLPSDNDRWYPNPSSPATNPPPVPAARFRT